MTHIFAHYLCNYDNNVRNNFSNNLCTLLIQTKYFVDVNNQLMINIFLSQLEQLDGQMYTKKLKQTCRVYRVYSFFFFFYI